MGGVADLTVNGTAGWLYDTPTGSGLGYSYCRGRVANTAA